jgi:uncharacterized protein (TIGR02302 family)
MDERRTPQPEAADDLLNRLASRRTLARLVLVFEALWPALWPALGVAGAFLCLALLDVFAYLPARLHATLLAAAAIAFAVLLARGLREVSAPRAADADRRLEQASGLRHHPLAVLADRPAQPGADALWRAHVARAAAQVTRLRVGVPHPGLAARDPRAMRAALVVGLFASLVIAGADAPLRIARAFSPAFSPAVAEAGVQLQGWITPPGYTGIAPVFLRREGGSVSVPAGSHLTISVTGGGAETPELRLNGHDTRFQALDAASFQADADLTTGGRLSVRRAGRDLGAWSLAVVADRPPEVSFPTPPGAAREPGRTPRTRLPWQVAHDYGVVELHAELRLRERPDTPPLQVPIPLPGGAPKSARGVRLQDLTAHPWAGLPVTARLVARDAPGLTGTSAEAEFVLPERRFENPVARALMTVRRLLTLRPDERLVPIGELDRLSSLPDTWDADAGAFLNLRAIASLLYRNHDAAAVDEAQSRLWQLALHLEEGSPERTGRALEQAQQALRDLMDAQQRGEKVDQAELDRRMRDVQEALRKHLQALADQLRRDPSATEFDPSANNLDAHDMEKLAEEMREAAREGRMDEAREKMAELDRMLEALKNARPEHGQTAEQRQRAEKRQRGQQQMSALQDMIRREGGLLDHAQSRTPPAEPARPFGQHGSETPPPDQADQNVQAKQRGTDQRVQQALRRALGELMQQYGDLTGDVPSNLSEADTAMRDSVQALGQSHDQAAAGAAQRAIEALQKGGRAMSQQMARQFGRSGQEEGDQNGDEGNDSLGMEGDGSQPGGRQYGPGPDGRPWPGHGPGDRRADERRDPLGRPLRDGTSGMDESGDVRVPDQMEEARTRAIQEELRRRGAERSRPQPELDYIERLLKQF